MKPVDFAIKQYGGVSAIGLALGVSRQLVWKWKCPRVDENGKPVMGAQDGNVPQKYWDALVKHAKDNGIDLTLNDLIYGRE